MIKEDWISIKDRLPPMSDFDNSYSEDLLLTASKFGAGKYFHVFIGHMYSDGKWVV